MAISYRLTPPYNYSFSPLIFSISGLSIFVIISGYLYGFGFFHLFKYKNNSEFFKKITINNSIYVLGNNNLCFFSHISLLETIVWRNSPSLISIDAI